MAKNKNKIFKKVVAWVMLIAMILSVLTVAIAVMAS